MLYRIGKSFATINETDSILYILLCTIEGESKEIRGESSSGKGTIADEACSYLPPTWYKKITGVTDKALRHLPSEIKMLYIAERRGLKSGSTDDESGAEYDVKLMISEGCLSVLQTVKDPNSETGFTTKERTIHVGSFLLTTTSELSLDEYDNRFHILNARDDPDQNRRVVEAIAENAELLPWKRSTNSGMKKIVQKMFDLIVSDAPKEVVIPYASQLTDSLDFSRSFIRRNIKKLFALIRASARIHYCQRPIIRDMTEGTRSAVVALPEDLNVVLSIGDRALRSTFNVLSETMIDTLVVCIELSSESEEITKKTVLEKLRVKSKKKISEQAIYKRLDGLMKKGFLRTEEKSTPLENGTSGKMKGKTPTIYALVGDADLAPSLTRLIDPERILDYEKRVEDFLAENSVPIDKTINFGETKTSESADLDQKKQDLRLLPFGVDAGFTNRFWVDPLRG
ncbi:MAG: hypothetical protein ACRDF4_05885, partial [Rhabdochlamydiaceae bacterium]